jgi:leucyl aminopeptidase
VKLAIGTGSAGATSGSRRSSTGAAFGSFGAATLAGSLRGEGFGAGAGRRAAGFAEALGFAFATTFARAGFAFGLLFALAAVFFPAGLRDFVALPMADHANVSTAPVSNGTDQPARSSDAAPPEIRVELATTEPLAAAVDLLVVACLEDQVPADPVVAAADAALGGALRPALADERFTGKAGQLSSTQGLGKIAARRIAFFGCGPSLATPRDRQALGGRVSRLARSLGAKTVAVAAPLADADVAAAVEALAEGVHLGAYQFAKYLSGDRATPSALAVVTLLASPAAAARVTDAPAIFARAQNTARAVRRARDLVNEPAGALTPTELAARAAAWAREVDVEVEVLDRDACRALGMGLYLAVAQGSVEPPRFIHLAWKPANAKRRVVLVGKGVTFDSGGLSLKTNEGMLDMKTDMAGAAAVVASIAAAAREKLPIEIHALAACTENMPSGSSYKLGDVLTSMAGKTVEINNTDAEGRLTLADALTFGLRFQPDAIVDLATLTGACVVALGPHTAGVMSNDESLAAEWIAAAGAAGEDVWRLPLPPRLAEQLKSEVADMKNTGERWGGALTAGLFLREFVGAVPWVHVDIAGPSSADKELAHVSKGGTGFGVATILSFLRRA